MTHSEVRFPFVLESWAREVLQSKPKYWKEEGGIWFFKPELTDTEVTQFDTNLVKITKSVPDEVIPPDDPEDQLKAEWIKKGIWIPGKGFKSEAIKKKALVEREHRLKGK